MNILIVHAHPEPKSFCTALKDYTVRFYEERGDIVKVTDLYQIGFEPVGVQKDFLRLSNNEYFKYQTEQVHAYNNSLFTDSVLQEMEKIEWADLIIFSFPLWWFSLPAILKGWVDRIFAMGFCYGAGKGVYDNGAFRNKTGMLMFTTGGPEFAYSPEGKNGNIDTLLYHIHHGMLYFIGLQVKPPFIAWSPARVTNEERESYFEKLDEHLIKLSSLKNLY
jgi:NAD(P)H dehydrogenase (quinone)